MLLVHQAGSVKIGEVIRYTLTYTPSNDRILPTPTNLWLRIKNTSAIPLRAAFIHGPYALHVSAYPATFNPHRKVEDVGRDGQPEFEPMLKAAGSWTSKLLVPEAIRETGADLAGKRKSFGSAQSDDIERGSVTWIIEVASQILFSTSASVHFEVLVGRDERSLDLGFAAVAGQGNGAPGQVADHKPERRRGAQQKGVYSRAVKLTVDDTDSLWDKPKLPTWDKGMQKGRQSMDARRKSKDEKHARGSAKQEARKKRKKVHLVVLTHGLHGNLRADMLFLKESIDATVKQARIDAKKRKEAYREKERQKIQTSASNSKDKQRDGAHDETSTAPLSGGQEDLKDEAEDSDSDDEEVIVRGFPGNAVRTENGIQYLGKRMAKYVLKFTYPDQPFLPVKKPFAKTLTDTFKPDKSIAARDGPPAHLGSSIHSHKEKQDELPYRFTSISFIGHSLGGLVQTYAIAYIHKHSPTFFQQIQPVNFVTMASPLLGLSNENPLYVKFALDFGLVGRTGQDLGLTWRPPTLARSGWSAMVGGLGAAQKEQHKPEGDPGAKPLLRILPTGPAHQVLRLFRNRTVYSNVVNDGIVPLRTSCLLFLDWRGIGKVDKARRENGLFGTMAEWGWAELTGANTSTPAKAQLRAHIGPNDHEYDSDNPHFRQGEGETVPQPDENETAQDNEGQSSPTGHRKALGSLNGGSRNNSSISNTGSLRASSSIRRGGEGSSMFDNFLDFFRPSTPVKAPSKKATKALRRGQTIQTGSDEVPEDVARGIDGPTDNPTIRPHGNSKRPLASRGDSQLHRSSPVSPPPRTSLFESASDILHPPIPSRAWITDPSARARTIFHDRVYHPEDIPPPPARRSVNRLTRSFSSDASIRSKQSDQSLASNAPPDSSSMKVEEKIARAYHKDLSWRKVLVRLEPDAHNNIVVRRMFANAYGWPVVKHLCDTHFADTIAATTRDDDEPATERAEAPMDAPVPETGEEVEGQADKKAPERSLSETREARDELATLEEARHGAGSMDSRMGGRLGMGERSTSSTSGAWDDRYFEGSEEGDSSDEDGRNVVQRFLNPLTKAGVPEQHTRRPPRSPPKAKAAAPHSSGVLDGHRGLGPTAPTLANSTTTPSEIAHGTSVSARSAKNAGIMQPTSNTTAMDPELAERMVAKPKEVEHDFQTPASTAEVGLAKSVRGHADSTPGANRRSGSGSGEAKTAVNVGSMAG